MKNLLILAIMTPLITVSAFAETACRDFRAEAPEYHAPPIESYVIAVDQNILATVYWPPTGRNSKFAVKGTLCGADLQPLPNGRLEVIRYEKYPSSDSARTPLQAAELSSLETFERHRLQTSEEGGFALAGLAPGDYAVEIDWSAIESEPYVVLDLRVVPSYRDFLPSPGAAVGELVVP